MIKDLFHHLYSARDGALRVLLAVEREDAYANLALQKLFSLHQFTRADAALVTELVNGTLRMERKLDWVIDRFSMLPVAKMNSTVRNVVRLGVYQLLFLERVPASAACNESVRLIKLWKLERLAGFVNGLLRNISRHQGDISYPSLQEQPLEHISVCYSHPEWLVRRWLERYGEEETIALCRSNNQAPRICLRCNTLMVTPRELCLELEAGGLETMPSPLIPGGIRVASLTFLPELPSFKKGHFAVQDESSMLASLILNPRPGSLVIDCCSGPGGKATHLAQLMGNQGRLLAFDLHEHRLRLIEETARRLGITIIETRVGDASRLPEELEGQVDYLLVDVPCSGLGVIRRRPDLRWKVSEQDLLEHASEQLEILTGASHCLKKGGVLLYSTCSTEPEENTGVLQAFLQQEEGYTGVDLTTMIPFPLAEERDRQSVRNGYLQLLPHRHQTDGFFVALLRKTKV